MNHIIAAISAQESVSEQWEKHVKAIESAEKLSNLVIAVLQMAWYLGKQLLQAELEQRGSGVGERRFCPHCGSPLRSKGRVPRQIHTLLGVVRWKRRVLRCPQGCSGSHIVPSDEKLDIAPYEQTSWEVKRLGCLLNVFVPYDLATKLLWQLTGVQICDSSLWNWVQQAGQRAKQMWLERLAAMEAGEEVATETMMKDLEHLTMVLAADGVMVPFRPQAGTAKGKTQWQEVKVAVVARLQPVKTAAGKMYTRLCQRRLVAVLGDIDTLKPRLLWEALHQGLKLAPKVVWRA